MIQSKHTKVVRRHKGGKKPGRSTETILTGESSSVWMRLHDSPSYLAASFLLSLYFSEIDLMRFWNSVQAPALDNTTVCQGASEVAC